MKITLQKAPWLPAKTDALAFFNLEDKDAIAKNIANFKPESSLFQNATAMLASGDMTGRKDEIVTLYPRKDEGHGNRVFLVGQGKRENLSLEQVRRAAARVAKKAESAKSKSLSLFLPKIEGCTGAEIAFAFVEGAILGLYKYDRFFKKEEPAVPLENLTILYGGDDIWGSSVADVKKAIATAETICAATIFAREMENAPSNYKFPETLAAWAKDDATKGNAIKTTIFGMAELKKNKMVGIMAVGQGSAKESRFIIMEYWGSKKKTDAPIVLVGKGITFDTGGISIKPAAGMGDMKSDMSGGATVIATLKAVADLKLPINVIGLVSSAENMPSGTAIRPGDVITYANGVSAEIDNTDAEGRLVLADALIWAQKYNPSHVIDLATLTGACVVALGHVTTGMMGNDEDMKAKLVKNGNYVYERVCDLPIYEEYEELIKSDVADIKNVGGRWAGAITAALFLKRFTNYPWIHLDIAGTARSESPADYIPKGGTGVCVRMLTRMLMEEAAGK